MKGKRKKETDRRRGMKTISQIGQEWTLPAQLGQLKTGQNGKELFRIHLWCPDDLPRLWDRTDLWYIQKPGQNHKNLTYPPEISQTSYFCYFLQFTMQNRGTCCLKKCLIRKDQRDFLCAKI